MVFHSRLLDHLNRVIYLDLEH